MPPPIGARALVGIAAAICAASCDGTVGVQLPTFIDGTIPGAIARLHVPSADSPDGVEGDLLVGTPRRVRRFLPGIELGLLYHATLPELGLDTGPITHDPRAPDRLRRPDAVMQRDESGEWVPAADDVLAWNALRALRFEASASPCIGGTECVDEEGYCLTDCGPDPDVALPAEPMLPEQTCAFGVGTTDTEIAGRTVQSCGRVGLDARCDSMHRTMFDGTCASVGRACASDAMGFAVPPSGATVHYVRGSAPGGDGSRASPWDLDTALARAAPGDVLLVAAGSYAPTTLRTAAGVKLYGACATQTSIRSGDPAGITGELDIDGITLQPAPALPITGHLRAVGSIIGTNLSISIGAALEGNGSILVGAAGTPDIPILGQLSWIDGEIRATRLVIRGNVRMIGGGTRFEHTFVLGTEGAHLDVHESAFIGVDRRYSIELTDSASTLTACAFIGGDEAIRTHGSTHLVISGAHFEHQDANGVNMFGPGADMSLSDSVFVTQRRAVRLDGSVMNTWNRVAIADTTSFALATTTSTGAMAQTIDLTCRDVLMARTDGGMDVSGSITLERVRMEKLEGIGLLLHGYTAATLDVSMQDLAIVGAVGAGIEIRGTSAHLAAIQGLRVSVTDSVGIGVSVREDPGNVTLDELTIQNIGIAETRPNACSAVGGSCAGTGLVYVPGVREIQMRLAKFKIDGADGTGLALGTGADFVARDGVIDRAAKCLNTQLTDDPTDHLIRVRLGCSVPIDTSPL